MENKNTLVIGASTNPSRYSYLAVHSLRNHGHKVIAVGLKEGKIADVEITKEIPANIPIDTVTLYVGSQNQIRYIELIEKLKPRRVIFNPGTENLYFEQRLADAGIEAIEACTLVLLSTGQY